MAFLSEISSAAPKNTAYLFGSSCANMESKSRYAFSMSNSLTKKQLNHLKAYMCVLMPELLSFSKSLGSALATAFSKLQDAETYSWLSLNEVCLHNIDKL